MLKLYWTFSGSRRRPFSTGHDRPSRQKLDAYRGIIEARLAVYPQLSAVRLLDEIRAAGYTGGYR